MQLQDFYRAMANLTDEERTEILKAIEEDRLPNDQHVQWMAQYARGIVLIPDDTVPQQQRDAVEERFHVLLATTPTTTQASMIAQIEWFKENLGGYVLGNATPAHDQVFVTLIKSARHLVA